MKVKNIFSTQTAAFQLFFLIMLMFIFLFLFTIIGHILAQLFYGINILLIDTNNINASSIDFSNICNSLLTLQFFSQIGLFIIPSILFFFLVRNDNLFSIPKTKISFVLFSLSIAIILFSLPAIQKMIEWNEAIKLPRIFSGIEIWMKTSEGKAERLTDLFLMRSLISSYLLNIIVIGIVPAVGEEMAFRGILQPLFTRWIKRKHLAVIITAILFSAMHLQFYGFFPRLFLGIVLGYMFLWSKSLWFPILAHFVNNFISITVGFLFASGYIKTNYKDFGTTNNIIMVIMSIISIFVILYFYRQNSKKSTIYKV